MLNSALLSSRFAILLFQKPALMAWTMHVEVHITRRSAALSPWEKGPTVSNRSLCARNEHQV